MSRHVPCRPQSASQTSFSDGSGLSQSVFLPVVEMHQREIVQEYRHPIEAEVRRTGQAGDVLALEIGELAFLTKEAGFDHDVASRAENPQLAQNPAEHGRLLQTSQALALAQSAAIPDQVGGEVKVDTRNRREAARRRFLGSIPSADPSLTYNLFIVNQFTSRKRTEHLETSHSAGPKRSPLGASHSRGARK